MADEKDYKKVFRQIGVILGLIQEDVKLEKMPLEDGVTMIEAEIFEAGQNVNIVTEDGGVPLAVGEYKLQDGRILVVSAEGVIGEIKEAAAAEEPPVAAGEGEPSGANPTPAAPAASPKSVTETVSRELRFSQEDMDAKEAEIEELKVKLSKLETLEPPAAEKTETVELEKEPKKIVPNPESGAEVKPLSRGGTGSIAENVKNILY